MQAQRPRPDGERRGAAPRPVRLAAGFMTPAPAPAPPPDALPTPGAVGATGRREGAYWRFYDAVAARQTATWLREGSGVALDLSGSGRFRAALVSAGYDAVQVCADAAEAEDLAAPPAPGPGRVRTVVADRSSLGWLADGSVDAVLAEGRCLSLCLAAEVAVADIVRVLRPGGRLLLCVDSLVLGLSRLAEQGRWAELADVPSADVVLVPAEDGSITRCFWPEEVHALLADAGLDVDWVRPRSVLSQAAVERALAADPGVLDTLVTTEVALAQERQGESTGMHLLASAHRPA